MPDGWSTNWWRCSPRPAGRPRPTTTRMPTPALPARCRRCRDHGQCIGAKGLDSVGRVDSRRAGFFEFERDVQGNITADLCSLLFCLLYTYQVIFMAGCERYM